VFQPKPDPGYCYLFKKKYGFPLRKLGHSSGKVLVTSEQKIEVVIG